MALSVDTRVEFDLQLQDVYFVIGFKYAYLSMAIWLAVLGLLYQRTKKWKIAIPHRMVWLHFPGTLLPFLTFRLFHATYNPDSTNPEFYAQFEMEQFIFGIALTTSLLVQTLFFLWLLVAFYRRPVSSIRR